MTTNSKTLFSIDAMFSCSGNEISVVLTVQNNLTDFSQDEQRILVEFMLSHYESIPVLNMEPSTSIVSEELNGKSIRIELTNGNDGFELDINGHELVMQGEHKANCAQALHKALLDLESQFINLAS
ncbi:MULTISPECIES: hypothetical protein [Pseudoalteromonas]|uniref:hypothetical protein n=1 Tax=Pseudoalteromonas TaxID=53246 RepID=UPI0015829732|nr:MULTISPECIES: hypothetical protein [Pseudoalteromonas]MDI4652629.1 hypothetical protein [Pseudoalteromonas shioyasakiensis]NUJ38661.1 hypothetical protein [Pseudoalteromonas sp. 0303]